MDYKLTNFIIERYSKQTNTRARNRPTPTPAQEAGACAPTSKPRRESGTCRSRPTNGGETRQAGRKDAQTLRSLQQTPFSAEKT